MNTLRTFFSKLNWRTSGQLFGFGTSPAADWKIIFVFSCILATMAIVASGLVFLRISKEEVSTTERTTEQGDKILDTTALHNTVLYYQNKEVEFERIKAARTPAVDPSL